MQFKIIIYKNGQVEILKSVNGVQWDFVIRTTDDTVIEDLRD